MNATRQMGFTLVELMVTLAVVAILATIALPSIGNILATSELNAAQEEFVQILKKARGLAMSQSTIATVVVTASTKTATLTLADSSIAAYSVTAPSYVSLNVNAVYTFSPVGTATISPALTTTILSTPNYTGIGARTISVTSTGVVNVSH